VLVALAAVVTLTSVAAAGPDAAKQRVAITTQAKTTTSVSAAALAPFQPGMLQPDSGKAIADLPREQRLLRDGQELSAYEGIVTFKGRRGTLVIRFQNEYADGGNGYHPGTGTWKVVRGTGVYAGVKGGGRSAHVWLDSGPWTSRLEGFVTAG
jgi:hypothetical protein